MLGAEVRDVVEDGGADRLQEPTRLDARLLVAGVGPGLRAIVALPEEVAGQVGVARVELVPRIAVEVPLGLEEGLERCLVVEVPSLGAVEVHQLRDLQRPALAVEGLGLSYDVARLPRELGLDMRRLGERGGQCAGLVEGEVEVLGRGDLLACELAQRLGGPGVADRGAQRQERSMELGPELRRLFALVRADSGEVAADPAAELERRPQVGVDILRDVVPLAGDDGLEGARVLADDDLCEHAGGAERPGPQGRQPLEVARDLVAPAPGGARLVVAAKGSVLLAEDMPGVLLEIVALPDPSVGLVDLGELAAAAPPEDDVHHHRRAGDGLAAPPVVARQAVGAEEVVAQQYLLAQAPVQVAAEEPRRDQEDADAPGHQEVEGAAHEVGVGALLRVERVGILAGHRAALAVGRV